MNDYMEKILKLLNEIFCEVFNDNSLVIDMETGDANIAAWDDKSQALLWDKVEERFGVRFNRTQAMELKRVDKMVQIIANRRVCV